MVRTVVAVAIFALALFGLQAGQAGAVDLRVTYAPANFAKMYEALSQAFMQKHPDVKVTLSGNQDYSTLSQQTLRSALTGDLPDVSHEGLFNIRVYADRGLAVPLDTFIAQESDWAGQGYSAAVARVGQVKGVTYGIPFSISTQVIFINLDLAVHAGADPNNLPRDWDGIIALAERIGALGDRSSGIYFDYYATAAVAFETLVFSQGGSMMDPGEKDIAFDGREGRWAMDLLKRFGEAGQPDLSRSDARQAFVSGTLGIYQNTSSNIGNFDQQANFKYAVIPVPVVKGGLLPAAGNGIVMFSKDPEKQRAGWEYIKFASSVEGQAIMAKMTGYVPVNSRVLDDPEMKAFYKANPNFAVPLTQVGNLTSWYTFPGENAGKAAEEIIDAMRKVVNREVAPGDALEHTAKTVRQLLKTQR